MLFPNLINNVPKSKYFKTATSHFIHNNIYVMYSKQICICSSQLYFFNTFRIWISSHNFRIMSNIDQNFILFSDEEEEMDVGESGELGDEGHS